MAPSCGCAATYGGGIAWAAAGDNQAWGRRTYGGECGAAKHNSAHIKKTS